MSDLPAFPQHWTTALVIVAHPDDPEYGMAAAVARWTREGKRVDYLLASSGEAGIEGMDPSVCGPIREEEQRRSGAAVGVENVDFLGFPDSQLMNTADLREAITEVVLDRLPEVVLSLYRGPEWGPGRPNQSDHIETGEAVVQALGGLSLEDRPKWVFESSPQPTHLVAITENDFEAAVVSLSEHREYLSVLDPSTPVEEQARSQVEMVCRREDGALAVGFAQVDL